CVSLVVTALPAGEKRPHGSDDFGWRPHRNPYGNQASSFGNQAPEDFQTFGHPPYNPLTPQGYTAPYLQSQFTSAHRQSGSLYSQTPIDNQPGIPLPGTALGLSSEMNQPFSGLSTPFQPHDSSRMAGTPFWPNQLTTLPGSQATLGSGFFNDIQLPDDSQHYTLDDDPSLVDLDWNSKDPSGYGGNPFAVVQPHTYPTNKPMNRQKLPAIYSRVIENPTPGSILPLDDQSLYQGLMSQYPYEYGDPVAADPSPKYTAGVADYTPVIVPSLPPHQRATIKNPVRLSPSGMTRQSGLIQDPNPGAAIAMPETSALAPITRKYWDLLGEDGADLEKPIRYFEKKIVELHDLPSPGDDGAHLNRLFKMLPKPHTDKFFFPDLIVFNAAYLKYRVTEKP
ncbi:hypothetical protein CAUPRSCDRAFT_12420, partial [Caulochytrium protostelioides]